MDLNDIIINNRGAPEINAVISNNSVVSFKKSRGKVSARVRRDNLTKAEAENVMKGIDCSNLSTNYDSKKSELNLYFKVGDFSKLKSEVVDFISKEKQLFGNVNKKHIIKYISNIKELDSEWGSIVFNKAFFIGIIDTDRKSVV